MARGLNINYSHYYPFLLRLYSSKAKSSSSSSNQSRKLTVKAQLLDDHEQVKVERRLQQLIIQEEQLRLQHELEKVQVLGKLDYAQNKVNSTQMFEKLYESEYTESDSCYP